MRGVPLYLDLLYIAGYEIGMKIPFRIPEQNLAIFLDSGAGIPNFGTEWIGMNRNSDSESIGIPIPIGIPNFGTESLEIGIPFHVLIIGQNYVQFSLLKCNTRILKKSVKLKALSNEHDFDAILVHWSTGAQKSEKSSKIKVH